GQGKSTMGASFEGTISFDAIAGQRIELAGKIQEAYGVTTDEAEQQIKCFEDSPPRKPAGAPFVSRKSRGDAPPMGCEY
ncbi:MAG: hypothetical protein IPK39_14635, partial [Sulfuritalea sp.]|nr:hypothetical protein [Sulfuritalea sp.]